MLTGDNEKTARTVAEKLGIDEFEAGVRPEDKHERIKKLKADGRKVAMAGDGKERRRHQSDCLLTYQKQNYRHPVRKGGLQKTPFDGVFLLCLANSCLF
ncbi:MAG TPA: HAD family hydrolase [Pirellulales bacterium]|nr:HAD family hydrolase [Pirellulales bacterium]